MIKNNISLSELQYYVNLLEDINGKRKYLDYELLCSDLLIEFGIRITKDEIYELYEPTVIEHIEDLKLIYDKL